MFAYKLLSNPIQQQTQLITFVFALFANYDFVTSTFTKYYWTSLNWTDLFVLSSPFLLSDLYMIEGHEPLRLLTYFFVRFQRADLIKTLDGFQSF